MDDIDPQEIIDITIAAADLITEIAYRWPDQAGDWTDDPEMAAAWARAILETGADPDELQGALARVSNRPYPPSIGALLANLAGDRIEQARASLASVLRALAAGDLSKLDRYELHALAQWPGGAWALRSASGDLTAAWRQLLDDARHVAEDDLPPPVERPTGSLPPAKRSAEENAQGRRRAAEIRQRFFGCRITATF